MVVCGVELLAKPNMHFGALKVDVLFKEIHSFMPQASLTLLCNKVALVRTPEAPQHAVMPFGKCMQHFFGL